MKQNLEIQAMVLKEGWIVHGKAVLSASGSHFRAFYCCVSLSVTDVNAVHVSPGTIAKFRYAKVESAPVHGCQQRLHCLGHAAR